jgi:hypothetical protein
MLNERKASSDETTWQCPSLFFICTNMSGLPWRAPARYDNGIKSPLFSTVSALQPMLYSNTCLAEMLPRLGMMGVIPCSRKAMIVSMMGKETAECPRMIEFRRASISPLTQAVGIALLSTSLAAPLSCATPMISCVDRIAEFWCCTKPF